ncbi:hypothetical protein GCM10010404_30480 [Nonomuraea africana]
MQRGEGARAADDHVGGQVEEQGEGADGEFGGVRGHMQRDDTAGLEIDHWGDRGGSFRIMRGKQGSLERHSQIVDVSHHCQKAREAKFTDISP